MTKEKSNLIKTLKDENLRAETHKYTQNLINNNKHRSLTVPNNNNIKNKIENKINKENKEDIKENNTDNRNIINNDNEINDKEKKEIKENNEIKKKKKVKKKIKKKGEKVEPGQKYKLLTYKTLNDIRNEEADKEKGNKIEDIKSNNANTKDKNDIKIKNEISKEEKINSIIKDKISEKSNITNDTRRDLLNSLSNLQYNFDNLMEIGVHGNKYLKNKKK